MTTRKRNEWLEAELSDEDDQDQGYDSDAVQESRTAATGRIKRRKVSSTDEEREAVTNEGIEDEEDDGLSDGDSQKTARKSGVIYLSRIPPFMKPATLKSLLAPHAPHGLNRIFLTPETPAKHTARVRSGGNKKRSFTDGWVEFLSKKDAKIAAETLNGNIIGGKKGGWYHDDVWNMKYLRGFKWSHLTEQISNENAERAARLRAEISVTTRENKRFVENVERAKMLEGMESKKKAKRSKGAADTNFIDTEDANAGVKGFRRQFKQNEVKLKTAKDRGAVEQSDDVKRVLSRIF
ncbi:RNA-binding ATPase activator esf2 [Cryomyces antarcticus]|nr:RNA-binding ATPase activator esf2 [Cryomyces antarcticus]